MDADRFCYVCQSSALIELDLCDVDAVEVVTDRGDRAPIDPSHSAQYRASSVKETDAETDVGTYAQQQKAQPWGDAARSQEQGAGFQMFGQQKSSSEQYQQNRAKQASSHHNVITSVADTYMQAELVNQGSSQSGCGNALSADNAGSELNSSALKDTLDSGVREISHGVANTCTTKTPLANDSWDHNTLQMKTAGARLKDLPESDHVSTHNHDGTTKLSHVPDCVQRASGDQASLSPPQHDVKVSEGTDHQLSITRRASDICDQQQPESTMDLSAGRNNLVAMRASFRAKLQALSMPTSSKAPAPDLPAHSAQVPTNIKPPSPPGLPALLTESQHSASQLPLLGSAVSTFSSPSLHLLSAQEDSVCADGSPSSNPIVAPPHRIAPQPPSAPQPTARPVALQRKTSVATVARPSLGQGVLSIRLFGICGHRG